MTTINFTDSLSAATTFATKLLAGTLNFYHDWEIGDGKFHEIIVDEPWFTTKIIDHLRAFTHDMEISRLVPTDIAENPDSMGSEGQIRSVTLYAKNDQGVESEVATFDVKRDFLDGDTVTGWTNWRISNVVVKIDDRDYELISQDYKEGVYLSDRIWGQAVRPT